MRRLLLVVFAFAVIAGAALGIELNASRGVGYILADGLAVVDSSLTASSLPNAYLLWANDSSDDVWIRRRFNDEWESAPGIKIPAGRSLVIPLPASLGASGYWRQMVYAGGLADTVSYIPWDR